MTDDISTKIHDFFAQYNVRRYPKGQILLLNGDTPSTIYHLNKGQVKVYDITYRGDEIILNVFKPPAFFPMSLVINHTPNPFIYEAETAIELHEAPAEDVVAFIKANPDVMFDLLSRVYRGVDGLLGRMAQLMSNSARSRLIYELLNESRRFGKAQPDGSHLLEINEKGLAARAGLSRETVSREINKLKSEGLISIETKHIRLTDVTVLQQKLGQDT